MAQIFYKLLLNTDGHIFLVCNKLLNAILKIYFKFI